MRRALVIVAALVFASSPRFAHAQEATSCGGPGRPGIVLRAEALDPAVRGSVVEQLRAALAARSFELCDPANATGAVAELDVTSLARTETGAGGSPGVAVTLAVRDDVTDKRVSRDLDLRRIPRDGRALVIAQAADELLRASWAELLVADAPKPLRAVPPEITRAVPPPEAPPAAPPAAPSAPVVEVGAAAAFEHFGSGHTQVGPDLAAGVFPLAQLGVIARGGLRSAGASTAPSGTVEASALAAALAVVVGALPRSGRAGIDAGTEVVITHVRYAAEAGAGARAHTETGTAVHLSAVARGWLVLTPPLRVTLGLTLGAPIHTVRAIAADSTIASLAGLLAGAQLGLGAAW